jgi:glucan phosphoethanolaminetransferase (alkaline phosphatase superfamily)
VRRIQVRVGFARAATVAALAALVVGPDLVLARLQAGYAVAVSPSGAAVALLLAALVVLARSRGVAVVFVLLVFLLQATELAHHRYFGVFYSAFEIELMTGELRDTALAALDLLPLLALPLVVCGAFAALALLAVGFAWRGAQRPRRGPLPILALAALVLILAIPFVQALGGGASQRFQPNMLQPAVKNGLYSHAFFLARRLRVAAGRAQELPSYAPYRVDELESAAQIRVRPRNVVLLLGESTSYLHMRLFGYARDTTPDLQAYADDPAFIGIRALSRAVSTRVSLALFYNLIREPDNARAVGEGRHSLYRLAKAHGFATTYISTQQNPGGMSYAFAPSDIDHWRDTRDMRPLPGDFDDRLLKTLQGLALDYRRPNFITLHMRSAHAPYADNYPRSQARFPDQGVGTHERLVNGYDNAILYTQRVIADVFGHLRGLGEPFYVFYIPDHGEVLGQGGRYGHNTLDLGDAKVPFFFYGVGVPQAEIDALRARLGCLTNHDLVGEELARVLGYAIVNPNQQPDVYFLNGVDAFGEAGFLRYRLSEQRQRLCAGAS